MSDEGLSKANKDEEKLYLATSFAAARFCMSLCKGIITRIWP